MAFNPAEKHPLYEKWLPMWQRQRDAGEGEDRVKSSPRALEYLPRLDGQGSEVDELFNKNTVITSYSSYKNRASFMNATGRTVDGLMGAVQRRDSDITWPESQTDALDMVGHGLESFSEVEDEVLEEVIGIGRFGHLVDMPSDDSDKPEPFVAPYHAEVITNWAVEAVKGRKRNTRVHLFERSGLVGKAKGTAGELEQYRILRLGVPEPSNEDEEKMEQEEFLALFGLVLSDFDDGPVYFQEIWVEVDQAPQKGKDSRFERVALMVPRLPGGALWREIPFTFFNPNSTKPKPQKPTLLDLTVVNFSHYRNSADLEHGLHFTALPQPWAAGFKFSGDVFIGSGVAWVTEEPNATAGYLEFTGQGLGALERRMEKKEKQMAALGARLLEEQTPSGSQEAAETVRLRHSGEGSALAKLSQSCSKGLTRTLQFLAAFRGITADVSVALNEDFGIEGLTPEMLTALMEQVLNGTMSWDTYVYNVRRGELYPDDFDQDLEAAAITAGPPGGTSTSVLKPEPEVSAPVTEGEEDELDEPEDES